MGRIAFICLVIAACSKPKTKTESDEPKAEFPAAAPAPAAPTAAYVTESEGKKAFMSRCAACHGASGTGDGPKAASLNPKPRNYTDKEWQKSVTDEQIEKTILYGGAAVGKSPNMPANPDLGSKPEMVTALRKVVRAFGQ